MDSKILEGIVSSRVRDLVDGFKVRRVLPAAGRRMVGPFIFLDQMGPEILRDGQGLDVAPHPHIGLATVTYMFEGELLHRDSLGSTQPIHPGDVNWMTAGRGIVHSERTPAELRSSGGPMLGLQCWVALRREHEECAPAFVHHPAAHLPLADWEGVDVRVIAGEMFGLRSPVETLSGMFYVDTKMSTDARITIPGGYEERAVYVLEGAVRLAGESPLYGAGQLLVLRPGVSVDMQASGAPARVMLLGGDPMDGPRHIYWNFVSSSKERIEQAKDDWMAGRFDRVPGEHEWIPLPGSGPSVVRYP